MSPSGAAELGGLLAAWRWTGDPLSWGRMTVDDRVQLLALDRVASPEEEAYALDREGARVWVHRTRRRAEMADPGGLDGHQRPSSLPVHGEAQQPRREPSWELLDDTTPKPRGNGIVATDRAWTKLQFLTSAS